MFENNPNTPEGWLYIGDDKVRYALGEPGSYNLVVIGLNPSTATPEKPDPTIKRIRKIVEKESLNGWIMVNLYPMRTPKPDELPYTMDEKIVKKNIEKRGYLVDECQKIVDAIPEEWFARGRTKKWHPKHPLYVT